MSTTVITLEAENASALLFKTMGAHRKIIAALMPLRPARLAHGANHDSEQVQCQATLVRLLSITESFASELLLREVDKTVARVGSVTIDNFWRDSAVKGTATWSEQKKSYHDWLGVDEDWKAVERLAEARNAVAHGLGTLTRRQLRNEAGVREKLRLAGIALKGATLILSEHALASATVDCRNFVHRVDLSVQARPPGYR